MFIYLFVYSFLVAISFFLFALPFNKDFQATSIVHGVGMLCAPEFLTSIENIGPFLFEKDHCQHSPWWQLFTLYGFFLFFIISFIIFLYRQTKIYRSDVFILLLIIFSIALILIPEFFYMKDIYPAHYRANTMFKLVFQAFILLSIASGYIFLRILHNFQFSIVNFQLHKVLFALCSLLLFFLVFLYPFQAIKSYYGLTKYHGLNGTTYLSRLYPDDYKALQWLNITISGQPVILEAQGDSYTDYGRVSTHTGLPTVLGWTVHEWLWRGSYDIPAPRIEEIKTMYETADISKTKTLIKKYHIEYAFVGTLERQKYTNINEEKFGQLGKMVFESGETRVYKINL